MRSSSRAGLVLGLPLSLALPLLSACGGAATPPMPPPAPPAAPVADMPAAPASAAPASALPTSDDDDPDESATPIVLKPEITAPFDKASFPKKTADEQKCWQSLNITGDAQKDFDALIASCGTPTGMKEYVPASHGHLHSVKDKRDTFDVKLSKGLCYRYFAVGDSGMKDIDILVEKTGGAIVGDDKQDGPVAIINASKPWCMTESIEYLFNIEIDGEGHGKYLFGIWARPN